VEQGGKANWLLNLLGQGFVLLSFGPAQDVTVGNFTAKVLEVGRDFNDTKGLVQQRFDGKPGTVYLIRPDQHVAARWRAFDAAQVQSALRRALKLQ
jgi:3-(3-hydroxy-phenyl)propionate hydroxylase